MHRRGVELASWEEGREYIAFDMHVPDPYAPDTSISSAKQGNNDSDSTSSGAVGGGGCEGVSVGDVTSAWG